MAKRVTNLPINLGGQASPTDRKNYSNEPYEPEDSKYRRWIKPESQKVDIDKHPSPDGEPKKTNSSKSSLNSWWVWVLVILGAIFLFSFIQEKQRDKELEDTVRNAANDANYCRSLAAEYGMQGDAIFHKVYNDCMEVKGW